MDSDRRQQQEEHGQLQHGLSDSFRAGQISDAARSIAKLPQNLQALQALSMNLYWIWNRRIRKIFEEIDLAAWDGLGHNPVLLLQRVSPSRFAELSSNQEFVSKVDHLYEIQRRYLHEKQNTWYQKNFESSQREELVAYFSAEFGLAECLRIYSGGLGILSGDHLKSASDLGIPMVGIGLFYKRGYFSQQINQDGWQIETYPENNASELPVEIVLDRSSNEPLIVSVAIEDRQVRVRAWKVSVGRNTLFLLDTNLPGLNSKEDCEITAELYGGDIHTRIKQEMILGFGGAKVIRALGLRPTMFHMNEGHAAFVILERIREIIEEDKPGTRFSDAIEIVKSSNLFTTHTPVAAGIDVFENSFVERYLSSYCKRVGISVKELLDLGHEYPDSFGFNMAVFAIRMSSHINAVSKLHRRVASKLWKYVIDDLDLQNSLASVTNGVHVLSWVSDGFADLYDQFLGPEWKEATSNSEIWAEVRNIPNNLVWETHLAQKIKLIEYIRRNFSFAGYNVPSEQILDPNALTIGFARRFATYKRASLILNDRERLSRLLRTKERPIQFIFAGKAHPRDYEAKKLIQDILNYAKYEGGGRMIFLPDYDISITRHLVQGVDVWLNNPERPLEACGTSGMKALPNGVLNFSILDGWWDEAHSSEYGWTISPLEHFEDRNKQNKADAEALYFILENEIIQEYYDRNTGGVPDRWVEKMKRSIASLTPKFATSRMIGEYAKNFYFGNRNVGGTLNKGQPAGDGISNHGGPGKLKNLAAND
jgi:starch phosphorylase